MTMEDHLRRLIGDLMVTMAKLSADHDALAEKLKAAEPPAPPPPDDDKMGRQLGAA